MLLYRVSGQKRNFEEDSPVRQFSMKSAFLGFSLTFSASSFGGLPNREPAIPPPPPPVGAVPVPALAPLSTAVCYDSSGPCTGRAPGEFCDGVPPQSDENYDSGSFICKVKSLRHQIETPNLYGVVFNCECAYQPEFTLQDLPPIRPGFPPNQKPEQLKPLAPEGDGESILVPNVEDPESKKPESQNQESKEPQSKIELND